MIKQIIIFNLLSLFISCANTSIQSKNEENQKLEIKKKIKITLFQDLRNGSNTDKLFYFLIPFVKYGEAQFNFPESNKLNINTPINYHIAHILKVEIQNKYIPKSLYISDEPLNNADYIIKGKVNTFFCSRKLYSYWLSFLGVLTWYSGLPIVSNECKINIQIDLENKSGKVLFSNLYSAQNKDYFSFYKSSRKEYSEFESDLVKNVIDQFLIDIKPFLK